MKFARLLLALTLAAPVLGAPTLAHADAKGDKVLRAIDSQGSTFTDQTYSASMVIYRGGKKKKNLEFDMTMKGLSKQYIVFKAPGDVAGMKILMNGADLWMYNPEFKKVRKIAAHAQKQGFLGSEFTPEDMVMAKLADKFDAAIASKSGNITTLELTPKAGKSVGYSKLEVEIDKSKGGVTKITYFDDSGTATREQHRANFGKIGGKPFPREIRMKNLKTGNETVLTLSNIQVDLGVPDSTFSKGRLLRG